MSELYSLISARAVTRLKLKSRVGHQDRLPVTMQVSDGNQNDNKTMSSLVGTHIAQLCRVGIRVLVKDSAGYSDKALKVHEEVHLNHHFC